MTEDPQDPTQTQADDSPQPPEYESPAVESQPAPEPEVAPETPTPDSGLQTPLPDQPIETPQPDEQPVQPQVEDQGVQHSDEPAPDSQRAQRLDTANRISSLGANQVSEHERREAERDAAREEHTRRVRTPFDEVAEN